MRRLRCPLRWKASVSIRCRIARRFDGSRTELADSVSKSAFISVVNAFRTLINADFGQFHGIPLLNHH